MPNDNTRRTFLGGLAAAGLAVPFADLSNLAFAQPLAPTPSCGDDDEPTISQTEGPFFTPDSPERADLREPGLPGTPMILTGYVLSTACRPLPGALIDIWQCDDAGVYDNDGYRLRGHQFTDANGLYRFATIVPGLYPGRTRHFHAKIQTKGNPVLTTQFYFPDEPGNARDSIFSPELIMRVTDGPEKTGRFDVVLAVD